MSTEVKVGHIRPLGPTDEESLIVELIDNVCTH